MDLSVSLGYVIAFTTVLGSAAVIALLSLKAVVRALAFFRPSPKKNEIEQISTKSLEPNSQFWICPYCGSQNDKTVFVCGTCKSPIRMEVSRRQ